MSLSTPSVSRGRLIVFEGMDGSGKSTAIVRVAQALEARGLAVVLPRTGKEHRSRPARTIRRMTRDPRNLELSPRTELLLYCAREAQVLAEDVEPALQGGAWVLLDRSLLTPLVLGSFGRGLPRAECEAAVRSASGGRTPDLTLVFDVDPRTSRLRKRLDKIRNHLAPDPGRKGLAGSALQDRVRSGYLSVARAEGHPILHCERATPEVIAERAVKLVVEGATAVHESDTDAMPLWRVAPGTSFDQALAELPRVLGVYFGRALRAGRQQRSQALHDDPALCAWALDTEDPLRERASEVDPVYAVAGLARLPLGAPEHDLRLREADRHPAACARGLVRVLGDAADALRERLAGAAPGPVCQSLSGRTDPFARALRARLFPDAELYERSDSLRGCSDEASWALREQLLRDHPVYAIESLVDVTGPRADEILRAYPTQAPKSVLKALGRRGDAFAHDLREALLETGREVADSLTGLDDDRAWSLRERLAPICPSNVARSLLGFPDTPRVEAMRAACLAHDPTDLHLLRRLAQQAEWAERPGSIAFDDAD